MRIEQRGDHRVVRLDPEGAPIAGESDAIEVIGRMWGQGAGTVVIPVERLDPAFFDLRSGIAGAVMQKFVTARIRVVVLGDVSAHTAASSAFAAWVTEANRGGDVWFLADETELDTRLAAAPPGQ